MEDGRGDAALQRPLLRPLVTTTADAPNLADLLPRTGSLTSSRPSTPPPSTRTRSRTAARLAAAEVRRPDGRARRNRRLPRQRRHPRLLRLYGARPGQRCRRSCSGYLVLDNDFAKAEFGDHDPGLPLRVTIAHEYNHVLQFSLNITLEPWLLEATATWSEDHVFPDDNDYLNYVRAFAKTPGTPITLRRRRRAEDLRQMRVPALARTGDGASVPTPSSATGSPPARGGRRTSPSPRSTPRCASRGRRLRAGVHASSRPRAPSGAPPAASPTRRPTRT